MSILWDVSIRELRHIRIIQSLMHQMDSRSLLSLIDNDGKLVEARSAKVGFREVEIRGNEFFVNGKKIIMTATKKGRGVKFVSDENYLNVSLWPFSEATLESAMHINELPHEPYATVNVDHNIAGVGGIDTWSSRAAPIVPIR